MTLKQKYKIQKKVEEYNSQSNEEQKIFSRQSGIRIEDNINRTHLKDSVISKILYNLDDKDIIKNKTLIIKPTPLLNQFQRKNLHSRQSLKEIPSTKTNNIKKDSPRKTASIIRNKPKLPLSSSSTKINIPKNINNYPNNSKNSTVKKNKNQNEKNTAIIQNINKIFLNNSQYNNKEKDIIIQ